MADLIRESELLVEGGALLNHSLLMAGLVDRIRFYLAPKLLGGSDGKGVFSGHGIPHLSGAVKLPSLRSRMLDGDILIEAEVERCLPA